MAIHLVSVFLRLSNKLGNGGLVKRTAYFPRGERLEIRLGYSVSRTIVHVILLVLLLVLTIRLVRLGI